MNHISLWTFHDLQFIFVRVDRNCEIYCVNMIMFNGSDQEKNYPLIQFSILYSDIEQLLNYFNRDCQKILQDQSRNEKHSCSNILSGWSQWFFWFTDLWILNHEPVSEKLSDISYHYLVPWPALPNRGVWVVQKNSPGASTKQKALPVVYTPSLNETNNKVLVALWQWKTVMYW